MPESVVWPTSHSMVSAHLQLADHTGAVAGAIEVKDAFFNPRILGDSPGNVDLLLQGAASQVSQEVDLLMVDDLRSFLFGPPAAGGLDLAAINIQRGRDVGLPDFRALSANRNFTVSSFSNITSNPATAEALAATYNQDINNVDAWVGILAEDHVPGASVGRLLKAEIESQFQRLRDGDRLFHRSAAAGLYVGGALKPEIAAIIDLDTVTLANILAANTSLTNLQENVFFVRPPGDLTGDGAVDGSDILEWQRVDSGTPSSAGSFAEWRAGVGTTANLSASLPVPEPGGEVPGLCVLAAALATCAVSASGLVRSAES